VENASLIDTMPVNKNQRQKKKDLSGPVPSRDGTVQVRSNHVVIGKSYHSRVKLGKKTIKLGNH